LHIAAWNGCVDIVKLLLENKADVNACRQTEGATALYVAAENEQMS